MSDEIDVNRLLVEACDSTQTGTHLEEIFTLTISAKVPYWAEEHLLASLARNPNTPPNHLEWLAIGHPEEVVQNPALELLILEDPAFPHADVSVERLAGVPGCPESIRRRSKYSHLGVTLELTSFSADAFSVEYLKDDERNAISQQISKIFLDEIEP